MFNVSLLWPYQGEYKPLRSIEVEGKMEYEVEKIIQNRKNGRTRQNLERWIGYDANEDC